MSHVQLLCGALPNIPWQDRPAAAAGPLWRCTQNPIIGRNPVPGVARIFNSAVMPYQGAFIGVFRGEQTNGIPYIYLGRSADGVHWDFAKDKIPFVDENGAPFMPPYAYDPRLVEIEGTYYIIWCQDFYGASIGMAKTTDFKTFTRIENPFVPFNRNAVLFPRKVGGYYTLLSRPSDSGHTPFGDIFLSQSPDMEFWGRHRHVMGKGKNWWEAVKIGGGAAHPHRKRLAAHRPWRAQHCCRAAVCALSLCHRPGRTVAGHCRAVGLSAGAFGRRARGRCVQRRVHQRGHCAR